jgi:hypothetical protein
MRKRFSVWDLRLLISADEDSGILAHDAVYMFM